jgi:hypothetical protein
MQDMGATLDRELLLIQHGVAAVDVKAQVVATIWRAVVGSRRTTGAPQGCPPGLSR